MHTPFFLFIAAYVVVLCASVHIFKKLKDIITTTQSKEKELKKEIGEEPERFHYSVILLMAVFVQRQRLDKGCIEFIYNYIMQAVPKKMREDSLFYLLNNTYVVENGSPCAIIDIDKTIQKDQLIFIDENLVKVSATTMDYDKQDNDKFFVSLAQSAFKHFSETGRKYMAYMMCRMAFAAHQDKPDFSELKNLLSKALNLGDDDIQELVTCGSENRMNEWYGKHIQSFPKNYPTYDSFSDMLQLEFPSLPPYDWKEKCVNRANLWCAALYLGLTMLTVFSFYVFKGSTIMIMISFPLFYLFLSFAIASVIYRFFNNCFALEDNRFNWKPTTIHLSLMIYTFVMHLLLIIGFVLG